MLERETQSLSMRYRQWSEKGRSNAVAQEDKIQISELGLSLLPSR